MIRILNDTHCQVLHRKTTHEVMLQAIADIANISPVYVLEVLLECETLTLDAVTTMLPPDLKHPKLTALVIIAGEFSYYDGMYRRRTKHSDSGLEAYLKVKTFVGEYLSKL